MKTSVTNAARAIAARRCLPKSGHMGIIMWFAVDRRNLNYRPHVQDGLHDDEGQALRAEGLDPDDPAVIAAIDLVRWELSLISNAAS
jgi:hypothetical protein